MAESICIHTLQGMVCYKNQNVHFTKQIPHGSTVTTIDPLPPNTPSVDPKDHWKKKFDALIHVARAQSGFDVDSWYKIERS